MYTNVGGLSTKIVFLILHNYVGSYVLLKKFNLVPKNFNLVQKKSI